MEWKEGGLGRGDKGRGYVSLCGEKQFKQGMERKHKERCGWNPDRQTLRFFSFLFVRMKRIYLRQQSPNISPVTVWPLWFLYGSWNQNKLCDQISKHQTVTAKNSLWGSQLHPAFTLFIQITTSCYQSGDFSCRDSHETAQITDVQITNTEGRTTILYVHVVLISPDATNTKT